MEKEFFFNKVTIHSNQSPNDNLKFNIEILKKNIWDNWFSIVCSNITMLQVVCKHPQIILFIKW